MTPYASDEARKAAHAKRSRSGKARKTKPLARAAQADLYHRVRGLVMHTYGLGNVEAVIPAALRALSTVAPRTLRDKPQEAVGTLYAALRGVASSRRDLAADVVLAAELVRAAAIEDRTQVLDAVQAEARQLPFASPAVREGFEATVRHLRAWISMGASIEGAMTDTRARLKATRDASFQEGAELAFERFQSRHGGQA
jgi:hypothetical protein